MFAGITRLIDLFASPFSLKYYLTPVAAQDVIKSLIVIPLALAAALISLNRMSVDVAEIFVPLIFLTPSCSILRSYLMVKNLRMTLGMKNTKDTRMKSLSINETLRIGIKASLFHVSPCPM